MASSQTWKAGTAALMAMAITTGTIAPMLTSTSANAQVVIGQASTVTIPAGVKIPVAYDKEKILVTPTETVPLTLTVASNIVDSRKNVLIPAGTEVVGQLQPAKTYNKKGSQFVAKKLVFSSGKEQTINATSPVVIRTEKIKKGTKTTTILQGAALGGAAAAAITGLTGNRTIETLEVLGGAGLGAIASVFLGRREVEVVSINPETDLNLTLRSNLALRP
jgi:outer membrane lipoprotein SlyB